MKLFFFTDGVNDDQMIVKIFEKMNLRVFTNSENLNSFSNVVNINNFEFEKREFLSSMDAIIVSASRDNSEIGFLTAHTLSYKKPILFLLKKCTLPNDEIMLLKQNICYARFVYYEYYKPSKINGFLEVFLRRVKKTISGDEKVSIKFTLRVSPSLNKYLQQQAKQQRMTKAVFLRSLIVKEISR